MKNKFTVWTVTTIGVLMGAWLVFAGVQTKDTAGGLFIGMNSSDLIGFHGATPVTQAVVSAATTATNTQTSINSTNNVAAVTNVAVQTVAPAAIVTNVLKQTADITYLGPGLTTNTATMVTNYTVQTITVAQLLTNVVTTTENAVARAGTVTNTATQTGVLVNEIRAALVGKGLVQ